MISNSMDVGAAQALRTQNNRNTSQNTQVEPMRVDRSENPGHEGSNASCSVTSQGGQCPAHSMVQQLVTHLS